jgi:hypothetical protein
VPPHSLTEVRLDQDLGRASSAQAFPRSDERGRSARSSSCIAVAVTEAATPHAQTTKGKAWHN